METLKNKDILEILRKGKSFKTKNLIVLFRKNNLGKPRFAFVISKRFSKKAVDRNKAKRIIKEAIRLYGETLKNMGYDIVIIPKIGIIGKKTYDLIKDINLIKEKLENNVKANCG